MPRLNSSMPLLATGLLVLLLAAWFSSMLLRPPAAEPAGPGTDFSAGSAWQVLERLAGDELPHPIGTAENEAVRERLVDEFVALGLDVEVQSAFACREAWASCGFVSNVIARVPGTAGQPSVLLTAHYDSVGAGPGVADDLAGVAALVEIARLERETERANPLLFVITDGEEAGLLGAEAFTHHQAFDDVAAVINVEARGNTGQSLMFETGRDNAWLVSAFAEAAPDANMNSLYPEIYRQLPNDTDFSVYLEAGLPGLNFAAIGGSRHYHTPLDTLANLSPDTLQHQGDNLLAAARALTAADLVDPPAGDSLFLTIMPGMQFQFPVGWSFYLALAVMVLWFVASSRLISTGQTTGLGLFIGVALALAAILLAAVLGQAISWLLPMLTGRASPWWADPVPGFIAIGAAAITAVMLAAVISAGRSGFWGLALGAWFWMGLLAFLLLEWLPGASVVFLVPASIMAVTYGLPALSPWRDHAVTVGLLASIALLASASIWWPMAFTLEQAMGLELGAGIAAAVALGALALMPLLALPPEKGLLPALLPLGGVIATVGAIIWAMQVPHFTEDAPQFIDILHLELAEEGQSREARWLLDALPVVPVPEQLDELLQPDAAFDEALPWTGWAFHQTQAETYLTDFPHVEIMETAPGFVRLALRSPRSGQQLHLFVPDLAGLTMIDVPGSPHAIEYGHWPPGVYRQLSCHGPRCDGLELELHFESAGDFQIMLADQTPGLPAAGADWEAARGNLAVQWQDGDVTLAVNTQLLEVP